MKLFYKDLSGVALRAGGRVFLLDGHLCKFTATDKLCLGNSNIIHVCTDNLRFVNCIKYKVNLVMKS